MLRPLPFESMRQQHHETARAEPLGLAGGNKLVDDRLGSVREVAELGLPKDQRLRIGKRIAIFEPEHAEFRKRAVANLEPGRSNGRKRDVFLTGLLVDPYGVTLT